ncbi:hypothetical protein TYRP_015217 [Tyrophagus putrescentiae]|nr:hypothetical protein TYRP_015217 [Tyrophagus putrescentiae]
MKPNHASNTSNNKNNNVEVAGEGEEDIAELKATVSSTLRVALVAPSDLRILAPTTAEMH